MVLQDSKWCYLVLHDSAWCCMEVHDVSRCRMEMKDGSGPENCESAKTLILLFTIPVFFFFNSESVGPS